MAEGASAPEAVAVIARGPQAAFRQVLAVDGAGRAAAHSGPRALGVWAEALGPGVAAGGNLLANAGVPAAMVAACGHATGHLADRLMAALQAGLAAGGEAGPVHSAGLLVVDAQAWPLVDLRCDWDAEAPIARLAEAWGIYRPQMEAYVTRALDPATAPGFAVPGDP